MLFSFELDAYMADGRPYALSKDFTFTFFEKGSLLPAIEALLQRRLSDDELDVFDVEQLIGCECMVSTKISDKGFANIATISRLARGVALPPKTNKPWFWWLDEDAFDGKAFERAPKWVQEKTMKSPEYQELFSPKPKVAPKPKAAKSKASKANSLDTFATEKPSISEELNDSLPASWGD